MRLNLIKALFAQCFVFLVVVASSFVPFANVALADTTTVAVVHTDFVPQSKIERLKEYALEQQVELISFTPRTYNVSKIREADFTIIDTPRMPDRQRLAEVMETFPADMNWVMFGGGPPSASSQMSRKLSHQLTSYYLNGTENNYGHLFSAIRMNHLGESLANLPEAEIVPTYGIYHDKGVVTDLGSYLAATGWQEGTPIAGFIISRNQILNQEFEPLDELIEKTKQAGIEPVMFWVEGDNGLDWLWDTSKFYRSPTVLVNLTHLQQGEQRKAEMNKLGVPVIQTIHFRDGDLDDWRESDVGIEPRNASVMLSTTETWGLTDPLVISADRAGEKTYITEQLDLLFGRVHAYQRLKTKSNAEKSVAVMFWNSPAGAENISASNLNVPLSLVSIAEGLNKEGYDVPPLDELQMIEDGKILLSGYYNPTEIESLLEAEYAAVLPLRSYLRWYRTLPIEQRHFINRNWGHPMTYKGIKQINGEPAFVFPILKKGNLWLMPQPPRSGDVGHAIHSTTEPPSHLYLAVYFWLQQQHNEGQLDALVHLGTHGSQEWTPGKARGLSRDDFPYLTLGDMPVFYPYIQDNIAEAIQAKRRGRATIISHQTPTFGPAGLYGDYVELNGLLGDYENALPGSVKDELKVALIAKIEELNVLVDMGLDPNSIEEDLDSVLEQLEEHIDRLAASSVPLGLHAFGQSKPDSEIHYTILQQMGDDLLRHFVDEPSEFWKQFEGDFEALDDSEPIQWIRSAIEGTNAIENASAESTPVQGGEEAKLEMKALAETAKTSFNRLLNNGEIESLLNGLSAGFIPAGPGGDPLRNPSTSSGTNLYGFDPAKVPSSPAYNAAETELQNLLDAHIEKNGEMPSKVAFSLWAGETQRHFGMLEAQVLRAIGVEPIWDRGGNLIELRVIPNDELTRPRIDVVIQATSVYRDQFDGFMLKLSKAIEEITALEDGNVIAENSQSLSESLRELGYDSERASMLSALRIFSNEPGDYGSGVNDLAIQSQDWESDDALGEQFTTRLQYAYGSEVWGEKLGDTNLFESHLSSVDAAVMTRTSRLHGLLSTDHPFEYLGGLAAAVRKASGKDPDLYINDLRESNSRTVSAGTFLAEELNARYLNPVWITSMQKEGYAGALNMLDITNNLFGWQVTAPETVNDHQWEALSEVYIDDKHDLGINEWFEQHQPAAQMQIIERMLEAVRKGHWDADEERLKQLIERHEELEPLVEYHQPHEVTKAFIEQTSAGFGLGSIGATASNPVISGQVMQEMESFEQPTLTDYQMFFLITFIFGCIATGAIRQHRITREA
ncbi:cobaltochelatase subunit CobN [Vibrio kyushuensis]|uniref:cobaltochelatase subunit CobN n=1 Tax=Vibrio kyushuensis TaxID=2910249 RepID=UPI003D144521